MNIKAAIFDMDGTLIDSLMLWNVLWADFGIRYRNDKNFAPSLDDEKIVRTLTLKEAMELIHINYKLGESGEELYKYADSLVKDFYSNKVELKAGVRAFLDYCKECGVKMCIASATATELLNIAIKHCNIGEYFQKVFSCAEFGKGKEYPDIYYKACEFLGEKPEDTWVFEDSLTAIETVTKVGMPTVGIYDKYNFGQDRIKEIATVYIDKDETLLKLCNQFD